MYKSEKLLYDELESHKNTQDKIDWTRKILNTKLPLLAIPSPVITSIVKNFKEDEIKDFLKLEPFKYHESLLVYAKALCRLNDPILISKYLDIYLPCVDNWALIDCLNFKITRSNKAYFLELVNKYEDSKLPFGRRLSLFLLLTIIRSDSTYLPLVKTKLLNLNNEEDYYVRMMASWLLSECIIKYKDEALFLIRDKSLQVFITNKGISKCRDSYRLDKKFKDNLLEYRK